MSRAKVSAEMTLPDLSKYTPEQVQKMRSDFLIHVQGFLVGAALCSPVDSDVTLKINDTKIVEVIQLPEYAMGAIKQKRNIITIVDLATGQGTIFK